MASPEHNQAQPFVESTNNNNQHHQELLQSLNKLTLSTSSAAHTLPNSPSPNPNLNSNSNVRSAIDRFSSASPSTRALPHSPINRPSPNGVTSQSRSGTPSLLRKKSSMNSMHSSQGITPSRAPSRRTSFLSPTASRSPFNASTHSMEEHRRRPAPTAASVASTYLQREMDLLHATPTNQPAETLVILHDACYGHRFSRPRTSKGILSTIVERPERIQASVLGVSMAYVRLGERHCEGKHPIHPELDPTSLPSIPFRILKTTRSLPLTSAAVTNVHGTKWMEELKIMCDSAESKLALNSSELRRPEMNRGPDAEPPQKFHEGDLYLCSESLNAFEGALGAVCEAVDTVFSTLPHKRVFVAVRPPGHHCSASHPSGFCWVNNVHVGIMHGILNHGLTHAAIIDFDLHHGDGSQAIAWQHNKRGLTKNAAAWKKTSIGYFSLHDINSYPCEYGDEDKVKNASLCIDNAHGQNIWNVHLHEWKSDVEFWKLYQSKYSVLLEKARNYLRLQTERYRASGQVPKAAIFVSAGFDASEWEGAGMQRHKVNVPTEFYARLTRDVVKLASEEGLGVDGRVISVLEGGYSDRALYSGVLSHLGGLAGTEPIPPKEDPTGEMGSRIGPFSRRSTLTESEVGNRIASFSRRNTLTESEVGNRIASFSRRNTLSENEMKPLKLPGFPYDPNWWSASELDRLESAMAPTPPEPKTTRTMTPGNYSSPTQSSDAKMTEVAKVRRTVSGFSSSRTFIPRPPTPPPPDVPWTAAAHALSKLLIPSDRQVNSCKHEELNAEATKARRDRQSVQTQNATNDAASDAAAPTSRAPTRMSLRERKPARTSPVEDDERVRRKTIGSSTGLATEKASARGIPSHNGGRHARQPSRRLSAASTMTTATMDQAEPDGIATRPGSSQSIRPESSMSVRTQASTLNVKKARPAPPPRKESARAPRATKKKPPVPKATSTPAQATAPTGINGEIPVPIKKESLEGPSGSLPAKAPDTANDLENITTGMKKIKINVLTKEKKEARRKAEAEKKAAAEKAEAEKKAVDEVKAAPGTEMESLPPAQKPAVTGATAIQESVLASPSPDPLQDDVEPSIYPPRAPVPVLRNDEEPVETKVEASSPMQPNILTPTEPDQNLTPFPLSSPAQSTPRSAQDSDLFVPYQPDGPPPNTLPLSGPIRILEPNTGTPARPNKIQSPTFKTPSMSPSPARKGGHAFTATSSIPFAPRPVQETRSMSKDAIPVLPQPAEKNGKREEGIWEIPETPQQNQ